MTTDLPEPWQLYPMPPEQETAIRVYIRRQVDARLEQARADERERIAAYLDRVAASHRSTGLLGDQVSGNALAEAAEWCRDTTIWTDEETT